MTTVVCVDDNDDDGQVCHGQMNKEEKVFMTHVATNVSAFDY